MVDLDPIDEWVRDGLARTERELEALADRLSPPETTPEAAANWADSDEGKNAGAILAQMIGEGLRLILADRPPRIPSPVPPPRRPLSVPRRRPFLPRNRIPRLPSNRAGRTRTHRDFRSLASTSWVMSTISLEPKHRINSRRSTWSLTLLVSTLMIEHRFPVPRN